MKIRTDNHGSLTVRINKDSTGKFITTMAEIETGIKDRAELDKLIQSGGIQAVGKLEMATEREHQLVKELPDRRISASEDFLPSDIYRNMDYDEKSRFWSERYDNIVIDPLTNEHMRDGETQVVDNLIANHNLGLL